VSARGGRYERSMGGMVGAMLVVVAAVVAVVLLQRIVEDTPETPVEPVDHLEGVESARTTGMEPVHPRELPDGWVATSVHVAGGDRPEWGMGVLTDEGDFVGIRQQDTDVESLVDTYVDEEATRGPEVRLDGPVPGPWQTWRDEGGDVGYTTELEDEGLLVYGSAPAAEVEAFVASLTR
jgi:hypothetical protein